MEHPSSIKYQILTLLLTALFFFWLGTSWQRKDNSEYSHKVTHKEYTQGTPDTVKIPVSGKGGKVLKPEEQRLDTMIVDPVLGLEIRVHTESILDSIAVEYSLERFETLITRTDTIRIMDTVFIAQTASVPESQQFESLFAWVGIGVVLGFFLAVLN